MDARDGTSTSDRSSSLLHHDIMPPARKRANTDKARRLLSGRAAFDDSSEDELATENPTWQWVYAEHNGDAVTASKKGVQSGSLRKRKTPPTDSPEPHILGAKKGNVSVQVGDTVLLQGTHGVPWVGILRDLFHDEDEDEMMGTFVWFNFPQDIRNKTKRRTDALANEIYISSSSDFNPLETINGKATILSPEEFQSKYPSGVVKKTSKDHGRVFVCRRGVNVRTATYSEEFVWGDTYKGAEDIDTLLELVERQTLATRKRTAKTKKNDYDQDDFVVNDDDDNGEPKTPKKRQKLKDVTTPTSKRKDRTPGKFLTPTHKRIVVKKPLEFTPLGTRILSPSALSSPFQLARNQLHVSSVPGTLPCREEEFSTVYSHLEAAITDGSGSCIYISGTPGTGKTATVREVVAQLNASVLADELDAFIFVEINGMKVTDPHQSYSLLWEALKGDRVSPSHALDLLEREFSSPSPRRVPCVVLMDELDQLVTKNQSVMYNFFNWPSLRHSRLIVLAVANTMDLPERTLSNKISSRLGLTRITFPGYTHDQLMQIIHSRLSNVPDHLVHPDAIQFAARKVAAVSGDARRALDICRRAVELAEAEDIKQQTIQTDNNDDDNSIPNPATPSRTNRGAKGSVRAHASADASRAPPSAIQKLTTVTIATIKAAIAEATSSPLQQSLRALPLAAKLFLAALLARIRRTGVADALLGDVLDEAKRLGQVAGIRSVEEYLLSEEGGKIEGKDLNAEQKIHKIAEEARKSVIAAADADGDEDGDEEEDGAVSVKAATVHALTPQRRAVGIRLNEGKGVARVLGLGQAAVELMEAGVVGVEMRRGDRVGRVRLAVGDEEVILALRNDEEVRGLGFGGRYLDAV